MARANAIPKSAAAVEWKMTKDGKVVLHKPRIIILDILGPFAMEEFKILSREKKQFYRYDSWPRQVSTVDDLSPLFFRSRRYIREYVHDEKSWQRKHKGPLKLYYSFAQLLQSQRRLLPNEPKLLDPKGADRNAKAKSLVDYIFFSIEKNPTNALTCKYSVWPFQQHWPPLIRQRSSWSSCKLGATPGEHWKRRCMKMYRWRWKSGKRLAYK